MGRCEAELDVFSLVKISLSPSLTRSLPVSHSLLPQNTWRPGGVTGRSFFFIQMETIKISVFDYSSLKIPDNIKKPA